MKKFTMAAVVCFAFGVGFLSTTFLSLALLKLTI